MQAFNSVEARPLSKCNPSSCKCVNGRIGFASIPSNQLALPIPPAQSDASRLSRSVSVAHILARRRPSSMFTHSEDNLGLESLVKRLSDDARPLICPCTLQVHTSLLSLTLLLVHPRHVVHTCIDSIGIYNYTRNRQCYAKCAMVSNSGAMSNFAGHGLALGDLSVNA